MGESEGESEGQRQESDGELAQELWNALNGRDEGDAEVDALLAQLSAAALDPDNTAHANPLDISELQRLQAEAQVIL